ncbi:hypothetical protein T06_6507, partial [Trichinella sp. T6]
LQRHPCRIYSRRRRSNREAAQAQHPRVQPMESILQRESCRIHFRRRESWARHQAEDNRNLFRYT